MMTPIDPRTVRILHDEKVSELERAIELKRAVAEQREAGISFELRPAWYARAAAWMQAKLSFGRHVSQPAVEAAVVQQPCAGSPC